MNWYLLALAIILGCLLGAFLVMIRTRRERRHAKIVGRYVDSLMREGSSSVTASIIRSKYSKDKKLLESFDTALDLYLAFQHAQKTGG